MKATFKVAAAAAGMSLMVAPGLAAPVFADPPPPTATPIQHLVVIFQENISFDHYFGTYPVATNSDGTPFKALASTPSVNGIAAGLLTNNPNAGNPANGADAINPFRLSHSQVTTCDQNHDYGPEQLAFDQGLIDAYPAEVGVGDCGGFDYGHGAGLVMGYFDGNTVTGIWNYAQHFAIDDNSFDTTFGPSAVGALNLVAGQTGGVVATGNGPSVPPIPGPIPDDEVIGSTVVGDPQPYGDVCSNRDQARLQGPNIGDLLNAKGLSWGWFEGGFDLTKINPDGSTGCNRDHPASGNVGTKTDYIAHHSAFQFYLSTSNLTHRRPNVKVNQYGTSLDTAANHNYDSDDFLATLASGNLPAVSFIKAPGYQDGHAGYSDPLLEQQFIVSVINQIMYSRFWKDTAIVIAYDDSDGWYDHVAPPIVNSSATSQDQLNGAGKCGNGTPLENDEGVPIEGRCGHGPRLPLVLISPFTKANYVDHTLTDQSSIIRFIEDNWGTGRIGGGSYDALAGSLINMFDFSQTQYGKRRLILDPIKGN